MTDAVATPVNAPLFNLQRVFLKGQSFELPQGAQVFLEQASPQMELNLAVSNAVLADGIYEVSVRATLTAKVNDKALFLVEVDQAGIFEIRDVPENEVPILLEIAAPTILTPYLRTNVTDTLTRGTLAPFYIPEMNWAAMREQRLAAPQGDGAGN